MNRRPGQMSVFGLAVLACLTLARPLAQALPVSAHSVSVVDGHVEYILENTVDRTATAWAVEVSAVDASGVKKTFGQELTDEYLTTANIAPSPLDSGVLKGGARHHVSRRWFVTVDSSAVKVDVVVQAVVFDDGSSAGNPKVIDEVFARRAAERDVLMALLRELGRARDRSGPDTLDALAAAVSRMKSDRLSAGRLLTATLDIAQARAQVATGRRTLDTVVQAIEETWNRQHTAAVMHARRP